MVAVGNLTGILEVEPAGDADLLKAQLKQEFGDSCLETLLGQQLPFGYQVFHNIFLQVTDLCFEERGTLLSLLQEPQEVCNIIIG